MSVGVVAGNPDYTFTGTKNIPILFAGQTLEKFYSATTAVAVSNTDYVGEVKNVGDKVIIRTVPNITIKDYKKGQSLDIELPTSDPVEFTVDYAKYWNVGLDDVDAHQMDIDMMSKWTDDASQQLKIGIDTHVLGAIYADANASNCGATAGKLSTNLNFGAANAPLVITKTNVLEVIIDAGLALDEQDIPETDRWMIIPAWMSAMLKKSDLKDTSLTGDPTSPIRNGLIGRIDRFTLYNSNLLATGTDGGTALKVWYPIFGHKSAFAFVSQITKTEKYRPEKAFIDAIKGLTVYGFKTLQPTALGYLYAAKG